MVTRDFVCSLRTSCSLLALALTGAVACSHNAAGNQAAGGGGAAASAAEARPTPTPAPAAATWTPPVVEPPDGKWLTNPEGRQYFLQDVPRVEGWYHWLNEEKTAVRLVYGMAFEVASYDEDSIQIIVYKPVDEERTSPDLRPELTTDQKEAIAASYHNTTGTADRLTFTPFGRGLPSRGQWRNGFKVADMNGDGHPDIVHGPPRKGAGAPIIFLGDGQGGWRRWSEVRFPSLAYDYGDVAVADFNGDGRLDLAFAVHLRGFIVLVADGPASFAPWGRGLDFRVPGQGGADASGFSSRTLEAVDWNGDSRPDLASLGEGPRLMATPGERPSTAYGMIVFLNQGDGSWVRKDEMSQGAKGFGEDLAVADLDADGHLDAILGMSVQGAKDVLRRGNADGSWSRVELAELRPRAYTSAVDAADFDGDGRLDLAVGYLSREAGTWRTGVDVFLAGKDGEWRRQGVASEESRDWLTALDSGDLDADGKLDLAATTGDGEIWLFLGQGDGTFRREEEAPEVAKAGGSCRGFDIKLVNLDSDPEDELVAEFAGDPSSISAIVPMAAAAPPCPDQGKLTAWKASRRP